MQKSLNFGTESPVTEQIIYMFRFYSLVLKIVVTKTNSFFKKYA